MHFEKKNVLIPLRSRYDDSCGLTCTSHRELSLQTAMESVLPDLPVTLPTACPVKVLQESCDPQHLSRNVSSPLTGCSTGNPWWFLSASQHSV